MQHNHLPDSFEFLPKTAKFFIPNPSDHSFETLNNFKKSCSVDVFPLSHGVHRENLKVAKMMIVFRKTTKVDFRY